MNQTSGDSRQKDNLIVVFTAVGEVEKGTEIIGAGSKENSELDLQFTMAENGEVRDNNTLKKADGNIIKLTDGKYDSLRENIKNRKTKKVEKQEDKVIPNKRLQEKRGKSSSDRAIGE